MLHSGDAKQEADVTMRRARSAAATDRLPPPPPLPSLDGTAATAVEASRGGGTAVAGLLSVAAAGACSWIVVSGEGLRLPGDLCLASPFITHDTAETPGCNRKQAGGCTIGW